MIENSKNLKYLNISDCAIETDSNDIIIKAFKKAKNLEVLHYNYNELSDE